MPDDVGRLAYLVVLLIALGGFMVVEFRNNAGRTTRHALAWGLIFVAVVAAAGLWGDVRDRIMPHQQVVNPGRVEVAMAPDGHFHLTADVNGTPVRFVVDTGASTLALGERDARRIGIDPDSLPFAGLAQTANGRVNTSAVMIDSIVIGDIRDDRVPAIVIRGDLDRSLMGMSYLRRFARVGFEGNRLILER